MLYCPYFREQGGGMPRPPNFIRRNGDAENSLPLGEGGMAEAMTDEGR